MHTRYAPVRHSQSPEGDFTVRLACIRPAASVHPEPGSNSSLYYCLFFCSTLNLGFRLDALLCSLLKVPSTDGASPRRRSCAGLRLSKNFQLPAPPFLAPRSFRKRVQKYNLFPYAQHFFENIFLEQCNTLVYSIKNDVKICF